MIKNKWLIIEFIFILIMLTGCKTSTEVFEDEERYLWDNFVIIEHKYNGNEGNLYIVYDKDTKIEYYVICNIHQGGISPIYNSDGTIKVFDEE